MTFKTLLQKYPEIEYVVRKLIMHHTNLSTTQIFQDMDQKIDFDLELFTQDIEEYIAGKPLQYIIGYTYFIDLKLEVKEGVYIPRPETEALSEELIYVIDNYFNNNNSLVLADICSGSGAIALALNYHCKQKTYGLELSYIALEQARVNNSTNNCDVKFVKSNIDEFLIKQNIKVDVLVSNPPYIKPGVTLESRVQDHEPKMALFDKDDDGLSFYRHILSNHKITTKPKAIIAFEFGYDQKDGIQNLINQYIPNCDYDWIYDYGDNPRGVIIKKKEVKYV